MNDESSSKVITLIAGIATTLLVITFGFFIVNTLLSKGNDITNDLTNKLDSMLEAEYVQYDGAEVYGSVVSNLITSARNGDDNIYIAVTTLQSSSATYYVSDNKNVRIEDTAHSTLVKASKTKTSNEYINPSAKFLGTVVRNSNKAIVGITFVQQ